MKKTFFVTKTKLWFFISLSLCSFVVISAAVAANFGTDIKVNDDSTTYDQCLNKTGIQSVAVSGNNVYAAWADARHSDNYDGNDVDIFFAKGTIDADGQLSQFGQNIRINDVAGSTKIAWVNAPSIAVNQNGNIFVVWTDYRNDEQDIYLARSTDGGQSFLTNQLIDKSPISGAYNHRRSPKVAVANEYVYIIFGKGIADLEISISNDNGETFSKPVEINGGAVDKAVIAADGSHVYIAQTAPAVNTIDYDEVFLSISSDNGQTFSGFQKINDDAGENHQDDVSISASGDNLYLAWRDERENFTIHMAISHDRGSNFGNNLLLSAVQGATQPCVSAFGDNVAVSFTGNMSGFGGISILAKISDDAGQTWSNEIETADKFSRPSIGFSSVAINDQIICVLFEDDGKYHGEANTGKNIYADGGRLGITKPPAFNCDCDGDGKTGLAEVIKILQQLTDK